MKDYYYILGVDANSTLDEVKDAYRKLSKKLHPDLNQGDKYFEARFRDVKDAFETLRDPDKRNIYNQDLKRAQSNFLNEEQKRRQPNNGTGYSSGSSVYRSKRRGPGIGITIVFILIALIFGDYLVRSFSHPKLITVKKDTVTSVVPAKNLKHHKRKHSAKNKLSDDSVNRDLTDVVSKPTKNNIEEALTNNTKSTEPAKNKLVEETTVLPISNKSPVTNKIIPHGDILYTSNIRANATGVVNMREADSYSSAVVETIPANSKVLVLHKGNTYYKISYNSLTGYIPKWCVETK